MTSKNSIRSTTRIVAFFPALLSTGGIQEASRLTAAALTDIAKAQNWSTDFLSLNDPLGRQDLATSKGTIPFLGFGRSKMRFALSAVGCAGGSTRIVFAAHPNLALPAAQMKLLHPKLKMVVISHGVEVWQRLPALRRRALLQSDVLMAPSRYTIKQMVEVQGAARVKTRRVAWPLSPSFLQMAENQKLPVPPAFPGGLVVLTVARLIAAENYKGVDHLIRAVAQLVPKLAAVHLVVVGGGDDLPRHQELAAELGIAARVHFFDALCSAETAACYAHCDVFALPSTGEGFGFVFLEAMAFAKPVIGAAAGGVTDIVEDGLNGLLVAPGNVGQLGQALERLLTSESLRAQLGHRGAEIVRSKYRFEQFRSELEALLGDCGLASERTQ
jgi:phosphatidyl-myo-inositol dimannoside synthase